MTLLEAFGDRLWNEPVKYCSCPENVRLNDQFAAYCREGP